MISLGLVCSSAYAEVREYWIAAETVEWDFAPSAPYNPMAGAMEPFNADQNVFVEDGIGHKYLKSVYFEYTENWNQKIAKDEHLGILGPVIRAEVGDTIVVHFRNNSDYAASVHPHGVFYNKDSEGAPYFNGTDNGEAGGIVQPGDDYTYNWGVPERAGPGPNDPSSIGWVYHSHVDETADTNAGLIGPMVITRAGKSRQKSDPRPKDVDREFFSLFTVFDENASLYLDDNVGAACQGVPNCNLDPDHFEESNLMHGINGLVWGNNSGYVMNKGEHVRWYIIGMGTEVDLHTPHWHGSTLVHNGSRIDVAEVLPAATKTFDMVPDVAGTWMYHCHVNDHLDAGMMTTFTVE